MPDYNERKVYKTDENIVYKEETTESSSGSGPIRDAMMSMMAPDVVKKGGSIATSPAIYNDMLFFGANDGYLYALSLNGTLLWKFNTNAAILSAATVVSEMVYVRSSDGHIYALSIDGVLKWKFRLASPSGSKCAVVDNVLYAGAGEGDQHMYAISAEDGKLMWKYRTNGAVTSTPAVVNDTLFFGSGDGYVYALSKDGTLKWKFLTSDGIDSSPAISDKQGNVVWSFKNTSDSMRTVSEGILYIGSWDNNVYALTLEGKELWRYRTNGPIVFSGPEMGNATVYIGCFDGHLYALDALSGSLKWKFRTKMPITAHPVIHDDTIYVCSTDNCLYAVSPEGQELWKFLTGGYLAAAATIHSERIYFGSWDCYLYALSLPDHEVAWKFKTGKLESVPVDAVSIISKVTETNKRLLRLWKPETTAGTTFSNHVSVSPMYRSADPYTSAAPYKSESPYASAKKKSKWPFH